MSEKLSILERWGRIKSQEKPIRTRSKTGYKAWVRSLSLRWCFDPRGRNWWNRINLFRVRKASVLWTSNWNLSGATFSNHWASGVTLTHLVHFFVVLATKETWGNELHGRQLALESQIQDSDLMQSQPDSVEGQGNDGKADHIPCCFSGWLRTYVSLHEAVSLEKEMATHSSILRKFSIHRRFYGQRAWRTTAHGVAKSRIQLSTHIHRSVGGMRGYKKIINGQNRSVLAELEWWS